MEAGMWLLLSIGAIFVGIAIAAFVRTGGSDGSTDSCVRFAMGSDNENDADESPIGNCEPGSDVDSGESGGGDCGGGDGGGGGD